MIFYYKKVDAVWKYDCGTFLMMKVLKGKTYVEWLRSLELFSLEKRKLRGDLMMACSFLMSGSRGTGDDLCSLMTSKRTQRNSMVP